MHYVLQRIPALSVLALTAATFGGCAVESSDEGIEASFEEEGVEQDLDEDVEAYATEPDGDEPTRPMGETSEVELFGVAVGELVEVEDGIVLPVPEPGEYLAIEVMYADGVMTTVALSNDTEGHVHVVHPDDHLLGVPEGASAACATKCNDTSYSYIFGAGSPAKWKSRLNWYYRHTNSPVGKNAAIDAFKHGAAAVPSSRNSCGMADQSSAQHSYKGETGVTPGVTTSGGNIGCNGTRLSDGVNVIGWGGLPGSTLAVTCTRAIDDGGAKLRITDMDMRYDKAQSWYTGNSVPAGCSGRFSLRGVATHEFGHAYGLGHTAQCAQVMAPATGACTSANRKFGKGDVRGVRSLY